ncbi:hypothetical protein Tco_1160382 [Tanacetum coccineum]
MIVISSSDEDLSTDEEIELIGDIPFSNTDDDDSDKDDNDEEKLQTISTSTSTLRLVNAPDVDVGSSSTWRKSRK